MNGGTTQIHMLSIGSIGGSGGYYLDLAREDYYLKGGEPLGRWWGRGADMLVGRGTVQRDDLRALLKGYSPSGEALIQGAGREDHQRGWDLTFSAPKSVSVLWSQVDERTRIVIQQAHYQAVVAALDYLQDEAALTRRGRGGKVLERAGLVVATFEHGTSRALDPQLHTHTLVLNVGVRDDGTTGTILSKPFYQAKMTAGALYRAELANQLEKRFGCRCDREEQGTSFRVAHVPDSLCKEFSKRREETVRQLKAFGSESAPAAAIAAWETRRTKEHTPPRTELFAGWKQVAESFGFRAGKALNRSTRTPNERKEFDAALNAALEHITTSHGHFTKKELLQHVAVHAQGRGISAADIRENLTQELARTKSDIVALGAVGGQTRYTTKVILDAERTLLKAAERLDAVKTHGSPRWHVDAVLNESKQLTEEQRNAVRYLTQRGTGLRSLEGWAGTGKTTTLSAAREVLERTGYQVIGATLSAKAAKELTKGANVESHTLAMLDIKMRDHGVTDILKHEARQLARATRGERIFDMREPLRLNERTALIIDESAMVATTELAKLAVAIERAGGMLISVFDRKQLQAIGPGGGAAYLADKFGKADLTEVVRQHEEWMRDAVKRFADGEAAGALKQYELAGRLHVADDRDKAMSKLVSDWAEKEKDRRDKSLIFVGTRAEVAEVNARCQAARREAGELSSTPIRVGEHHITEGDRVLFTKNSKKLGVENGTLGTVLGITPAANLAVVKLDGGQTVTVPLRTYKSVQPGYAVTTHKGQGTTVDRAYLLAGGKMQDRHLSYVQASRARESTFIYTDRHEAGDKLDQLAKQMSREREKTLALQIAEQALREQRQQTIQIQQQVRL